MNKIVKHFELNGKEFMLYKGLGLQAYEVKKIDIDEFNSVQAKVLFHKKQEVYGQFMEKLHGLSEEQLNKIADVLDIEEYKVITLEQYGKTIGTAVIPK